MLVDFYKEINGDLHPETDGPPADARARAHLWMLRNDLRGYVLLGDPAARLPLQRG